MTMAVGLTATKIGSGQKSDGLGHTEIDYTSVKIQFSNNI